MGGRQDEKPIQHQSYLRSSALRWLASLRSRLFEVGLPVRLNDSRAGARGAAAITSIDRIKSADVWRRDLLLVSLTANVASAVAER
jgi:hypothetical protein